MNNDHYRKKQMARIIEMAFLIMKEPSQWTRPQLAKKFKVNKATIQRDINLLREMDIIISPDGKKGYIMKEGFLMNYVPKEKQKTEI